VKLPNLYWALFLLIGFGVGRIGRVRLTWVPGGRGWAKYWAT